MRARAFIHPMQHSPQVLHRISPSPSGSKSERPLKVSQTEILCNQSSCWPDPLICRSHGLNQTAKVHARYSRRGSRIATQVVLAAVGLLWTVESITRLANAVADADENLLEELL
ncbi:hypothetical protein BDZ45DRAFT_347412 [Acephala macrosclerotiorum]|nr:hypothetical protein BDZ45DRAFT_347412 [Acephala macrosclerotiorum]